MLLKSLREYALFELAVMPATGTAAACSYVRHAGFLATSSAGTLTYSAYVPLLARLQT